MLFEPSVFSSRFVGPFAHLCVPMHIFAGYVEKLEKLQSEVFSSSFEAAFQGQPLKSAKEGACN